MWRGGIQSRPKQGQEVGRWSRRQASAHRFGGRQFINRGLVFNADNIEWDITQCLKEATSQLLIICIVSDDMSLIDSDVLAFVLRQQMGPLTANQLLL